MMKLSMLLAVTCILASPGTLAMTGVERTQEPMERRVDMAAGCGTLQWTIEASRRKIKFQVSSEIDAEWVAVGLSENGGMKGADIVVIANELDDPDAFVISDRFSTEYNRPKPDVLQNADLLFASRTPDNRIEAIFERDLQTCDFDDLDIQSFKQWLQCASGNLDGHGDMGYHGTMRSATLVNLMLDEELLMERNYDNFVSTDNATELTPGVIVHGDGATSSEPYPIDFVMPGVTLDAKETTSYFCRVVELQTDIHVAAYEAVWNNGTTMGAEHPPDYLHHQSLFKCNPDALDPAIMDGKPFDCFQDMPGCDSVINHGKSGFLQAPGGISVRVEASVMILVVHYENPQRLPVENDTSGIRLWALPETQARSTTTAHITNHAGMLETIRIPADPEQKDYNLQFMISSSATKAVLPAGGVQVFGTSIHMHKAGVRARLQHIRNGENFEDILDTRSYDFDLQSPTLKRWRLLPGDALIMTCTFRPDPDKEIVGGLRTEDEMCNFALAYTPEVPEYASGVGYLVREGEPFRNCFLGRVPQHSQSMELPYENAIYPPDPGNFTLLRDYRDNLCDTLVRDKTSAHWFQYSDPAVYAVLTACATYFLCLLLERIPWISAITSVRTKRNAVVCLYQILFASLAIIPFLILAIPIFRSHTTFQAFDPDSHKTLRALMATQVWLYILELFYRIHIRPEVVVHHVLTAALFVFLNFAVFSTFAFEYVVKLGAALSLIAILSQPKHLALLLKYLGYAETPWWPRFARVAAYWFILYKLAIVGLVIYIMAESTNPITGDASWEISGHSFIQWQEAFHLTPNTIIAVVSVLLFGLLLDQIYTANVLLVLAKKYASQQIKTVQDSGTDQGSNEDEEAPTVTLETLEIHPSDDNSSFPSS